MNYKFNHSVQVNTIVGIVLTILLSVFFNKPVYCQSGSFNQVDLLHGSKKVTIPFRYVHNFIILEARIFGSIPVNLIFDTGAEHVILFKREYTDLLQVPYDKRIPVMGSDLSREIYALITRNAMFHISGLNAKPHDLLILEEDYFNLEEIVGTRIDGLIGGGYFRNLIVNIDYRTRRMTLYDPAYYVIPKGHIVLPVRIKTNKPYVDAEASLQDGSVVIVDLLLDTGAGVPLLLHTNSHPSLSLPPEIIRGKLGIGLGGYLEGYIGRIEKLTVGEVDFPSILTSFQDIKKEWLIDKDRFRNGIVGNQLLSRFNISFDYGKSQVIIKPYQAKQKPFQMDRSGLVIFAYGLNFNQFIVRDVIPRSPAEEAGIMPQDIILRIQGASGYMQSLDGITSLLQKKVGKKIKMVISRKGEKLKKKFFLRNLI